MPILGDVRKIVPKQLAGKCDRVVMPLPMGAATFLKEAISCLKPEGGIIHFYDFQEEKNIPAASIEKIRKHCKPKILRVVKAGQYSPRKFRICVDFTI